MKYKYHFRPAYNSEDLLIEIFSGVEDKNFITDLFNSIKEINPEIESIMDLWMNDEVIFQVKSDIGFFSISKDIWDFAFIQSEKDQECMNKINSILFKNIHFQKVEVDFENYKL